MRIYICIYIYMHIYIYSHPGENGMANSNLENGNVKCCIVFAPSVDSVYFMYIKMYIIIMVYHS